MKKLIVILSLILPCCLYANRNMEFSIQNKISDFLKQTYNISNQFIFFELIEKGEFPEYDLYNIELINPYDIELAEKMNFKIKVSSFFDKWNYHIMNVEVYVRNIIDIANLKKQLKENDKIQIIYYNKNIKFRDIGTIEKILHPDILIVKNSFGQLLKCRRISNDKAEVKQ